MSLHIHKIDSKKHRIFLSQNPKDSVTREPLKYENEVVFCAKCKAVMLLKTWKSLGGEHCEQKNTLSTFPEFPSKITIGKKPISINKSTTKGAPSGTLAQKGFSDVSLPHSSSKRVVSANEIINRILLLIIGLGVTYHSYFYIALPVGMFIYFSLGALTIGTILYLANLFYDKKDNWIIIISLLGTVFLIVPYLFYDDAYLNIGIWKSQLTLLLIGLILSIVTQKAMHPLITISLFIILLGFLYYHTQDLSFSYILGELGF